MSRSAASAVLLFTAFIWGTAFVAQATVMGKIGPVLFTALRFLLAAAVILPFAAAETRKRQEGGTVPVRTVAAPLAVLVAVFVAGQITQQLGIQQTSVTNAGFLTALYVILVPAVGIVLHRNWPHPAVWPAAFAALAGTWLLGGGLDGLGAGDLWCLLCSVFWALQVVQLGFLVERTGRPLVLAFLQSLFGGVVALVLAVIVEPIDVRAVWSAWPELLYAGALSGGLAFSLQAVGQRYAGAAEAAVIFSSEAVFAALAAALLLGERLDGEGWLGCGLILAGILGVQLGPLLLRRPPRETTAALPP